MSVECNCLESLNPIQNWMRGAELSLTKHHLAFRDGNKTEMDLAENEVQLFCKAMKSEMKEMLDLCNFDKNESDKATALLDVICTQGEFFPYLEDQEGAIEITLQTKRKAITDLRCAVYESAAHWLQKEMC